MRSQEKVVLAVDKSLPSNSCIGSQLVNITQIKGADLKLFSLHCAIFSHIRTSNP